MARPQYVGGTSVQINAASANLSLTSLTGGLASSPSTGDIVIVLVAKSSTTNTLINLNASGNNSGQYSPLHDGLTVAEGWDISVRPYYFIQS